MYEYYMSNINVYSLSFISVTVWTDTVDMYLQGVDSATGLACTVHEKQHEQTSMKVQIAVKNKIVWTVVKRPSGW